MAADFAIVNCTIRTMDPNLPIAHAVAWSDQTIVAVGAIDQVQSHIDAHTEVIDARGAVLTPGMVDGHQHLLQGAVFAQGLNLDRVNTLHDLRDAIAKERERLGPNAWLLGFAMEYAALEGQTFHHSMIDDVAGPGPMFLYALDVHTAFVNNHALAISGVDSARQLADASVIVCDSDGLPTGELLEMAAMRTVLDSVPAPTKEQKLQWYAQTMRDQNAVGITEIHMMDGDLETIESLKELELREDLTVRVLQHHFIYPYTDSEIVGELLKTRSSSGSMWQADGVKFMLDGVIDTGTAWLEEPDSHGEGTEPMWPDMSLYHQRVRMFHDAGFRIATHAIGDRAVREVLDGYAALPGGSAGRHRIEHIETSPERTVARFQPEGVTASMQPVHMRWVAHDLSDPWSQRLDASRCAHAWPSGDIAHTGALVVLGSDWPVAPYDPRMGFFAARERRAHDVADKRPVGTTRALTGEQTLAGYTINAARAVGAQDSRGMIAPGYVADIVMWQDDPSQVSTSDVVDLPVLLTAAAGRIVYRTSAL
ncbi:MAG: amidohydrolase family protein [Actinobacteria bacterium]|uniref:Unannotated protein n=1 Tax=freshwater metagenome TaxID=449393 RepID=A0A6J5YNL4_9ZZZZ|nr:amidohydrolase family protein [Actinomycetota bacterium]